MAIRDRPVSILPCSGSQIGLHGIAATDGEANSKKGSMPSRQEAVAGTRLAMWSGVSAERRFIRQRKSAQVLMPVASERDVPGLRARNCRFAPGLRGIECRRPGISARSPAQYRIEGGEIASGLSGTTLFAHSAAQYSPAC